MLHGRPARTIGVTGSVRDSDSVWHADSVLAWQLQAVKVNSLGKVRSLRCRDLHSLCHRPSRCLLAWLWPACDVRKGCRVLMHVLSLCHTMTAIGVHHMGRLETSCTGVGQVHQQMQACLQGLELGSATSWRLDT